MGELHMHVTAASDSVTSAIQRWDPTSVSDDLKDLKTPTPGGDVIRLEARTPIFDATLGIPFNGGPAAEAKHRLVAIGDSLTHGFQSDAIFNSDWSYPAMIARELGWYDQFRHPEYRGFGGLPL